LLEVRLDAFADVGPVRVDVAAIESGDGVASINRLLDGPHVDLSATAGFGRAIVLDAGIMAVDPRSRQGHAGVLDQRVVAAEVHAQKDRSRTLACIGDNQKQVNLGTVGWAEGDIDFFLGSFAAEEAVIFALDRWSNPGGCGRRVTVHVVLEESLQLRST